MNPMNKHVRSVFSQAAKRVALLVYLVAALTTLSSAQLTNTATSGWDGCPTTAPKNLVTYTNWVFKDSAGVAHDFAGETIVEEHESWNPAPCCIANCGDNAVTGLNESSTDGLYYLEADGSSGTVSPSGYVNPKYIVVGVEYAPPGSSSNVKYTKDTVTGNTTMTGSSFNNKVSTSISLSSSAGIGGFLSGKETTTISGSYAQQSGSSTTVAVSQTVSNTTSLNGYTDPVTGVNHNYDYIFVWLNPVARYTLITESGGKVNVTWNGYGYDLADQRVYNDMDVIGIPVGCINGYLPAQSAAWTATCDDIASVYARTWALKNIDGSGPGLTSTDLTNILHSDPFYTTYTPTLASGSDTTTDGRFTECNTSGCTETIDFEPNLSDTYSEGYTTTTTNTHNYSHTETFSVEQQFMTKADAFWTSFSLSLQTTDEMTWVYSSSYSINNSQGQTSAFTIVGPNPGYTGPLQFVAFQDNYFGTFMFYQ
jgi:hypothetical protein